MLVKCAFKDCNVMFEKTHKNKKYCSKKCRWKNYHSLVNPETKLYCQVCGKPLTNNQRKFCCRHCASVGRKISIKTYVKNCVVCGKPFEGAYISSKYCSDFCKEIGAIKTFNTKPFSYNTMLSIASDINRGRPVERTRLAWEYSKEFFTEQMSLHKQTIQQILENLN